MFFLYRFVILGYLGGFLCRVVVTQWVDFFRWVCGFEVVVIFGLNSFVCFGFFVCSVCLGFLSSVFFACCRSFGMGWILLVRLRFYFDLLVLIMLGWCVIFLGGDYFVFG